jgi:hypothetical protein
VELPHYNLLFNKMAPYLNPLLDLFLHEHVSRTPSSSSSSSSTVLRDAVQQHMQKAATMLQFMFHQARGLPMGGHSPFKDFMVDAATLRALTKTTSGVYAGPRGFTAVDNEAATGAGSPTGGQPQDVISFDEAQAQLCDVLELVLRSCNVLIERFHHSLFLYVLTGLDKYVSVERYIGPLVALIAVLLLQVRGLLVGSLRGWQGGEQLCRSLACAGWLNG